MSHHHPKTLRVTVDGDNDQDLANALRHLALLVEQGNPAAAQGGPWLARYRIHPNPERVDALHANACPTCGGDVETWQEHEGAPMRYIPRDSYETFKLLIWSGLHVGVISVAKAADMLRISEDAARDSYRKWEEAVQQARRHAELDADLNGACFHVHQQAEGGACP